MQVNSSEICPQFLGYAGVGRAPIFVVTFSFSSSLAASLVAHMCCREGEFFVDYLRASQSTCVSMLFHRDIRGV